MNIAVDIRTLMGRNRTGVGEYTYELLSHLFQLDKKNQYYLFYNSFKDVSENIPKWDQENVHFIVTKWPNKIFNLFIFLGIIKLDRLISQKSIKSKSPKSSCADLDYFFFPNINFISLTTNTKFILTIHDLSFEILPECFTWKQRLWHKIINPKKLCEKAGLILTPSENTKEDINIKYNISKEKIEVLYPGLSSLFKQPVAPEKLSEVRSKYNLPENYILFLGTIEPRKNIEAIIKSFLASKFNDDNYELIIAGSKGWKNNGVMKLIEENNNIRYIGYVENADKPFLYKLAKIFVYPSLYEGFGFPVLEAMAVGIPVITSNRSSLVEMTNENVYLINPYNINEIVEGVNSVSGGFIEYNLNKFVWENSAKKFLAIMDGGFQA